MANCSGARARCSTGRDEKLLPWITDSGIVAICADNFAVEAYPAQPGKGEHYPGLPLHALLSAGTTFTVIPHLNDKLTYKLEDFEPVATVATVTPAELRTVTLAQSKNWGDLIKRFNVKAE